jgi:hypothetical protein
MKTNEELVYEQITEIGRQYQEMVRALIGERNTLRDENAYLKALVAVYEAKLARLRKDQESRIPVLQ